MKVRIARLGKDLAVRISKQAAESANLREGDYVEMSVSKGATVIRKKSKPNYRLDELARRITPDNRHPETEWGPEKGSEFC